MDGRTSHVDVNVNNRLYPPYALTRNVTVGEIPFYFDGVRINHVFGITPPDGGTTRRSRIGANAVDDTPDVAGADQHEGCMDNLYQWNDVALTEQQINEIFVTKRAGQNWPRP